MGKDEGGERLDAKYFEAAPSAPLTKPVESWWHVAIPGFRSAVWWKAVVASIYYGFWLLVLVIGGAELQVNTVTLALAALAGPIFAIQLIRFWRTRLVNIAMLVGLLLACSSLGVSISTTPVANTGTSQGSPTRSGAATPPTHRSNAAAPAAQTPRATLTPMPTPSPTPTPTPSPTPTSTPIPTPTPSSTPVPTPTPTRTPVAPVVQPPPPPAVAAPPPQVACYPLSNAGNCYQPGQFCRTSDHNAFGLTADGRRIQCVYNNGWRWEPA